jgi:hypothetical protein|tara:strand:+ start:717 stop:2468 length:1752 start_codon:yes stop_codon:yes gene_type:complete
MPDQSQVQPAAFNCQGGLVLNRSTFMMQPGEALVLENFEPDVEGGYRRINGYRKYVNHIIPQTTSSSEKVIGVASFANKVIACRGEKIFNAGTTELSTSITASETMSGSGTIRVESVSGFTASGTIQIENEIFTYTGVTSTTNPNLLTGVTRAASSTTAAAHLNGVVVSSTWTEIDTGRTNAFKYRFERFNFNGTNKIIFVDETNAPVVFDSSFNVVDVAASAVAGSKHVASFKNHMFYAGKSTTPEEIIFSVPFDEDDFTSGSGAGSIKVDDTVVGLKVFRDSLFIFCENRIFKLTGNTSADFAMTPVTRSIGCLNGDTIQEFGGDLIFLGPDGLRTVAATTKIGDTELGTVSKNVQSLFDVNIKDSLLFESVVIADKTQYRIFFTKEGQAENLTRCVTCVIKQEGFEFSEIRGIKPTSTDTLVSSGDVIVLHGSSDGYVQRQEKGNTFDGTPILARYRSPDLSFGDTGIRKHMQRVIINYKPESAIDADLLVRYDNEGAGSARPAAYALDSSTIAAQFGSALFSVVGAAATFVFGGPSQPLIRQSVEGSGFSVILRINDGGETAPYSLKGFQLEYQLGARR